eukprot:6207579-Pleurochrysis_carterae.AAC.1
MAALETKRCTAKTESGPAPRLKRAARRESAKRAFRVTYWPRRERGRGRAQAPRRNALALALALAHANAHANAHAHALALALALAWHLLCGGFGD